MKFFSIRYHDVAISKHHLFKSHLGIDVIEIARCLDWCIAQPTKRIEGILVSVLLDVPSRRLWNLLSSYADLNLPP